MITKIIGKVTSIFPDDINTDDIIPAWTLQESNERSFFKKYAFLNYDPKFIDRSIKEKSNIIFAGKNFGCGSSREQAIYALLENNVSAIIAPSFPDIFYRNALNNGLVLITLSKLPEARLGQIIEINLKKKIIVLNGNKYNFNLDNTEATTFMMGGKLARMRNHLEDLLKTKNKKKYDYYSQIIKSVKPQTIVEKIVSDHVGKNVYAGDFLDKLPIDILFFNEVIGPPSIKDFKLFCTDIFNKYKKKLKIFDGKRVFFIPDHTVPSSSVAVSEGITLMENFSKKQSCYCFKEGDGIEHVLLIENGLIVPGEIILGTDSHTDTNGALNTLAFGVGTTDATYALATGFLYDFTVPETIRINMEGKFKKGVYAKDLILFLIGKLGVDGASRKIVEFGGPALKNMSMDSRTTISNMTVEMGARTGIFEYDQILETYLENIAKFKFKKYLPDLNCKYEKVVNINLSDLEPCVAFPHKPSNVTSVSDMNSYMEKSKSSNKTDIAKVMSLVITDAFLGACTNGRYEDFKEAAKVMKNHSVHPQVNFVVIPASRKVYNRLMKEGILQIFADAGANIESSNCGPCFGKHMGVIGRTAQMISSSNRNYIGRMGSAEANIFLASPVTVTASAIEGKIVDPRKYL